MEKRQVARIQPFIARCVLVHGAQRVSGYLTDISLGGAQVACDDAPPPPEARVSVEARFDSKGEPTALPARVRWVKPAEKGHVCGLTFDEPGEEELAVLKGVIERILRRADQLS